MSVHDPRLPHEVLDAHLRNRRAGRLQDDLDENYARDMVVLSHLGHFRGRPAVETLAALLDEQLRGAEFFYNRMLIDGPYAFLRWRAVARDMHIPDGADSYVITDGRIQLQTISYTVTSKPMAVNTTPRVSD